MKSKQPKLKPEEIFVQVLKDDGAINKVHVCAECGTKYQRVLGTNNNQLCHDCCTKLQIPPTSVCAECKDVYLIIPKLNNGHHCKECCKKNGDKPLEEEGNVRIIQDDKLPEAPVKPPEPKDNSPLKLTVTTTDLIIE